MKNLQIAKRMGWPYDAVAALDADVYDVLVEELTKDPESV